MSAKVTDMKGKITAATIVSMTEKTRQRDTALARYYAYRCAVWKSQQPQEENWAKLATMLGVARPVLTSFTKAQNASLKHLEAFARALGPDSRDEFERLARDWFKKYPDWEPGKPLPMRITHTGDPLQDGQPGGRSVYSDNFRRAVRSAVSLFQCSPDQARIAAEKVWGDQRGEDLKPEQWISVLAIEVRRLQRGSGERPSVKDQKAADPAE